MKKARERSRRNGGDDAMAVEAEAVSTTSSNNGGARNAPVRTSGLAGACDTLAQHEAG